MWHFLRTVIGYRRSLLTYVYDAGTEQDDNVFSRSNSDESSKIPISRLTHSDTDFVDGNP